MSRSMRAQVMDTLHGIGPVHALVQAQLPAAAPDPGQGSPSVLLAAVGHGRSGALAVLRQKLLPDLITNVPVPGRPPGRLFHKLRRGQTVCAV